MLKNLLRSSLIVPFCSFLPSYVAFSSEINIEKNLNKQNINFNNISNIILKNNLELKSLDKLVKAASFTLSSKIGKRYPSIDLNANGLPQYLYGRNYNNNSIDTKSSQFKASPSLSIRLDLIDPKRGIDIKSAQNNYQIALNNYEIKKKDLIKEAKSRYHKYQKSNEEIKNAEISVDLSIRSLEDAQSKFDAGIGTRFDLLEANSQLARDKQILEEKKIAKEIKKIALKEILNIKIENPIEIDSDQKLLGFWNYSLKENIENGLNKSLSLKNIDLQNLIVVNQAINFNNANKPLIYISNTLSSSFSKGSVLAAEINPEENTSSYSNTISLNFAWKIFNGGQNKNSYKAKKAEAEAEKYSYENLQNIITKNISETYLNLKNDENKLISTKKEISSTIESLRLARLRYEVGISTLKDVLIRQKELSDARSKNIIAIYNYNLNLDELERLTFQQVNNNCSDKSNKINSICNY